MFDNSKTHWNVIKTGFQGFQTSFFKGLRDLGLNVQLFYSSDRFDIYQRIGLHHHMENFGQKQCTENYYQPSFNRGMRDQLL